MLKTIATYFQYLITCRNCRNSWIASRVEIIDLDIVTCRECGGCNLNVSKTWEV